RGDRERGGGGGRVDGAEHRRHLGCGRVDPGQQLVRPARRVLVLARAAQRAGQAVLGAARDDAGEVDVVATDADTDQRRTRRHRADLGRYRDAELAAAGVEEVVGRGAAAADVHKGT